MHSKTWWDFRWYSIWKRLVNSVLRKFPVFSFAQLLDPRCRGTRKINHEIFSEFSPWFGSFPVPAEFAPAWRSRSPFWRARTRLKILINIGSCVSVREKSNLWLLRSYLKSSTNKHFKIWTMAIVFRSGVRHPGHWYLGVALPFQSHHPTLTLLTPTNINHVSLATSCTQSCNLSCF